MDERVVKFRVGVIVLATMIVLAILILLFNDLSTFLRGSYTIFVHFPEAPGVAPDTPVRKDGILVGKVVRVRFADDDPRFETEGGVIATVRIAADRRINVNERCRINTTLLGDAVLQFDLGGSRRSPDYLQNGDFLQGSVAANPLQLLTNLEGNIGGAISSVAGAGNDVGKLARRLESFLDNNDDQLQRIVTKTERSLDAFQRALQSINVVLGDVDAMGAAGTIFGADGAATPLGAPDGIAPGDQPGEPGVPGRRRVTTLPELMSETRDAIIEMRAAVVTANRNLANLERFTQPLGDRGEELIVKVDRSVGRLDELLQQFVLFSQALNRKEGTLGQIVNNPELYQHINAAACNIEQLTRALKPIIADVRVFTDKLARHPGMFLREAVKPNSGIK
jgi:phospholipid/cholesterol/gamma-HCH transport system substrate-binding protein